MNKNIFKLSFYELKNSFIFEVIEIIDISLSHNLRKNNEISIKGTLKFILKLNDLIFIGFYNNLNSWNKIPNIKKIQIFEGTKVRYGVFFLNKFKINEEKFINLKEKFFKLEKIISFNNLLIKKSKDFLYYNLMSTVQINSKIKNINISEEIIKKYLIYDPLDYIQLNIEKQYSLYEEMIENIQKNFNLLTVLKIDNKLQIFFMK